MIFFHDLFCNLENELNQMCNTCIKFQNRCHFISTNVTFYTLKKPEIIFSPLQRLNSECADICQYFHLNCNDHCKNSAEIAQRHNDIPSPMDQSDVSTILSGVPQLCLT